jgi:hypothetical protein
VSQGARGISPSAASQDSAASPRLNPTVSA